MCNSAFPEIVGDSCVCQKRQIMKERFILEEEKFNLINELYKSTNSSRVDEIGKRLEVINHILDMKIE